MPDILLAIWDNLYFWLEGNGFTLAMALFFGFAVFLIVFIAWVESAGPQ